MKNIPAILQPRTKLFRKHFSSLEHPLRDAVETLLVVSDYACRQTEILKQLLAEDDGLQPVTRAMYHHLANDLVDQPYAHFASALRHFRHRHFLRLLLREFAGLSDTRETMRSWSDCADALILRAIDFCRQEMAERFGTPRDLSGDRTRFYVLAMGKLGGRELNYSSDVDLIFVYTSAGHTDGRDSITNEQYFTKIAQRFIQLLQSNTVDGFVFRVDLRLRPNGESGALVSTLASLETYYQEQGRDWERYAMAKARVICRSEDEPCEWYDRLIVPFVYRRYVDFSVIESLRSMKALIEREIQLNPMLNDIKRGLGGIREIEFIIQNIQLIRGGRLPQIRQQNALAALESLRQEKLLSRTGVLKEAYLFLRKLENCLQSENDQQTHSIPEDPVKQAQLVLAMDYPGWEKLMARLQQFQRIISAMFHTTLGRVDTYEDSHRLLNNQLAGLWQGHIESAMAVNLLSSIGYQEPERCYQMIHAFRHAPRCRRLNQAARIRLDRFMVLLLNELTAVEETESVLLQVMRLLENIVGRSAYLALLSENSAALRELLYWFAHSPFITSLLVSHPFLLEVLLEQEKRWRPPSRKQLEMQLRKQLDHVRELELQEEILRQFKLINWLQIARAEMVGQVDAIRAGRFLADVAQVIVIEVLGQACRHLATRYPEIEAIKSSFAMIAYGKLGSMEMNYNSDLDLVFVHSVLPEQEGMVNRLTQKIIHMLTTRSQFGLLYPVDTRLRPSGSAGLLVSPLAAFVDYQRTQAWTWEHQALIRGRVLYGDSRIRRSFRQLKKDVLAMSRNKQAVRDEVLAMRHKMAKFQQSTNGIKRATGGLIDLEFLVQCLVLCYPLPRFNRYTNTLNLMRQLAVEKIIDEHQFHILKKAYQAYHHSLHRYALIPGDDDPSSRQEHDVQDEVAAVIESVYGLLEE
ncbi:bifunctional [glutamate--ammonia ligase]-adenylyl-L-tyrosine phosphorylase/[glutamate--ammonia-ligase] adenylyltransferase [Legionella spiritensis]|uniref:Adenylyl transferase n=1 Tax=Legionella spiritensis TaxID=452 RepID=A0A0W0YWR7_LEGSP|nr:bifunctional [glutamate--ammonia ligase]-adenylyl-L-tyrosine phosphorylase/[glutamate--ammonia-ligase] adenylyltransferase [Legionella spiritensis]KTD61360.1 adenylyl transferase [Legionella spiritensis]SNV33771.1 adenylyl transferase [Legionella spiritensis]